MRYWVVLIALVGLGCTNIEGPAVVKDVAGVEAVALEGGVAPTLVTRMAPDFTAPAVMPDNTFGEVKLSALRGKYVYLVFYPGDFTFVCPTEIIAFNERLGDFQHKQCAILAISVDSQYSHLAWKKASPEEGGIGPIAYPLVSDLNKNISRSYGVLHRDGTVALRGWVLVDRTGRVRHALINDLPLGRSIDEAMRILDAVRFVDGHPEVCPVNWKAGDEGLEATSKGVGEYLSREKK